MIPGVNIIRGKSGTASINIGEGSGVTLSPSVGVFLGGSPLWKSVDCKEHLDWLRKDLNAAEIITV